MKKILVLLTFLFSISEVFAQNIAPNKPTSIAGTQVALNNQINVTWTAPSGGVGGYKIYYKMSTNRYDSVKVGSASTSHVLNNLIYNDTYKIYLRAYRVRTTPPLDTLYSPKSDSISVRVVGLVAPTVSVEPALNTPTRIGVIITDSNPFETGFQIELSGNGATTLHTAAAGTNVFQPIDGLKPKTTYGIRSRAVMNGLFGPWSNQIFGTTKVDFPPAATLISDKNCPTLAHIVWTIPQRAEDVQEIIIKKSYDNSSFTTISTQPAAARDYWDSDVIPGKTVFYQVFTSNSKGSTPSVVLPVSIKDYVNPNPVQNIISDQNEKYDTFLTFKWTNGAQDTECGTNKRDELVVLIKKNNETEFTQYARLPPFQSSLKIDGLAPKTIVTIGIISVSDRGKISQMITKTDTTYGPPYAPYGIIGVALKDPLEKPFMGMSWNYYNFNDHDYFKIEKRVGTTGSFQPVATIQSKFTNINDFNVEEGVIYYYRVKGGNFKFGDGAYSEVAGPFILDYSKIPDAPAGLIAKVNGNKVNLKWQDESIRESGFKVEKSADGGQTYILVANLAKNTTSYTDENVLPGKNYIYRVIAFNSLGDSPSSNLAEAIIPASGVTPNVLSISLYPNPTINAVNIQNQSEQNQHFIINVFDKNQINVLSKELSINSAGVQSIDLSKFEQGFYHIVVSNGKISTTKKIFKF